MYRSFLLVCSTCPEGLFIGKLQPQHLQLVLAHWHYQDQENTEEYIGSMIKNYHNAAVFQVDDPTKPVGWVMQHPFGQLGHEYVLEEHRGKKLSLLAKREVCNQIIKDGDFPETCIVASNAVAAHLTRQAGFVDMGRGKVLAVGFNKAYIHGSSYITQTKIS